MLKINLHIQLLNVENLFPLPPMPQFSIPLYIDVTKYLLLEDGGFLMLDGPTQLLTEASDNLITQGSSTLITEQSEATGKIELEQ